MTVFDRPRPVKMPPLRPVPKAGRADAAVGGATASALKRAAVDVQALYEALDTKRKAKGISWREAAEAIEVSASTLTRMGQGASPDVEGFAKMVGWLGVTANDFFIGKAAESSKRAAPKDDLVVVVSRHLRASKELDAASAKALENIIQAAYTQMKELKSK